MTRHSTSSDATLWERYHATRSDTARNALLEYHWRWIAGRVLGWLRAQHHPKETLAELLSVVAQRTLTQAIPNFDPARGMKFRTFLSHHILGAIRDSRRTNKWARGRRAFGNLAAASEALSHTLGRTPTEAEVASAAGMDEQEMILVLGQAQLANPTCSVAGTPEGGTRTGRPVVDVADPSRSSRSLDTADRFNHLTRGLTAMHRRVLWLHYYEGCEMREIATMVGISAPLVSRQIAASIDFLRKHRDRIEAWHDMKE